MEKVCIILLNWNNWKDTIDCLESLDDLNYYPYQIVIADNDSDDHSVERIVEYLHQKELSGNNESYFILSEDEIYSQSFLPETYSQPLPNSDYPVLIIRNKGNYGFGKGNNVALKLFLSQRDAEYAWLLNNDTTVDKNALHYLVKEISKDSQVGAVGSTIFYHDNPSKIQTIGGGAFFPYLGQARLLYKNQNKNILAQNLSRIIRKKLFYIMGASLLIKKEVLQEVGVFDEDYFLYAEEMDLCYRIRKKGYSLAVSLCSWIYHKESSSLKDKKHFYYFYLFKSNLLFIRKHFHWLYSYTSFLPIVLNTMRSSGNLKCLEFALKGYFQGLNFKKGVSKS